MLLYNKLKRARLLLNLTQKDIQESTGLSQRDISQLENGEKKFIHTAYIQFLNKRNIPLDALYDESISVDEFISLCKGLSREEVLEISEKGKSNIIPIDFAGDIYTVEIPIVDIHAAAAGYGAINSDHIEQLGVIKLPANMVKRGTNYCVRIKGSSMSPTIQDSDYVIVRLLEPSEWKSMPDQHVYLVVDREGAAYLKRVKNRFEKGFIVCTSDSIEKSLYPNFNLDTDEIFNIFHAEWHFSAKMQNINETYYSRLQLLEDDMSEVKEYLKKIK